MALEALVDVSVVREMVRNGMTHFEIIVRTKEGLVRYCKTYNITKITDTKLKR